MMNAILKGDFVYRSSHPLVVEYASGSRLFSEGREFIDCQASSGAAILGYVDDILGQLDTIGGPISKPQTCESPRRLKLANRLSDLIFVAHGRRGKIGFELGGAQAIELALKAIFCAYQNISIVTIDGAYHGRSLFTSHLSSSRRYSLGTRFSVPHFRMPNPFLVAERDHVGIQEATQHCIRYVEQAFQDERYGVSDNGSTRPVFLFEPIQNVAGMLDLPAEYLLTIEAHVRALGGLCVADEIFSGIHRFGPFFAHPEKVLTPDIVAFSKGLTNGIVPLSAVWIADSSGLAETFHPGTHSCTYLNNELSFIIANWVLNRLSNIQASATNDLGDRFLAQIQKQCAVDLGSMSFAKGSVLAFRMPSHENANTVSRQIMEVSAVGVLHASTGLAPRSIIFHPPYTLGEGDLCEAASIVATAIECSVA